MNVQADAILRDAKALLVVRRLDQAMDCFQHAEVAGAEPDGCAAGRWMIHMLQGDFEAAWRESDEISRRSKPATNRFWQGESLQGKHVLLRCLHGFGDAVQFLRFAPKLRAVTSTLVVEVHPRLVDLAGYFEGIEHVITWGEAAPTEAPAWDVQIEIMELSYMFRTQLGELPLLERYLKLPKQYNSHD